MKQLIFFILFLILLFGCSREIEKGDVKMKLSSNAFNEGGMIPAKFTCQGEDVNPQLLIEDVPAEAKSLALIVDDPDAPGDVFTHWVLLNLSPDSRGLSEAVAEHVGSAPFDLSSCTVVSLVRKMSDEWPASNSDRWGVLTPTCAASEQGLREAIVAYRSSSTHRLAASSAMLLILLLDRCSHTEGDRYWKWTLRSVDDAQRDLCAPAICLKLLSGAAFFSGLGIGR